MYVTKVGGLVIKIRSISCYGAFHVSSICLLSSGKMPLNTIKANSFIRGYHEYQADWEPILGDIYKLMREPTKEKDVNAVAVVRPKPDQVQTERAVDFHPNILNKEFEVIGQVPKLMATWLTRFLKRHTNCGKVVIKGKRVNRGGGFGLEVPCEYIFEGDNFSCEWLHRSIKQ